MKGGIIMNKISKNYRIDEYTSSLICYLSEQLNMTQTDVVENSVNLLFKIMSARNFAKSCDMNHLEYCNLLNLHVNEAFRQLDA